MKVKRRKTFCVSLGRFSGILLRVHHNYLSPLNYPSEKMIRNYRMETWKTKDEEWSFRVYLSIRLLRRAKKKL
jgi:hypothetical protein